MLCSTCDSMLREQKGLRKADWASLKYDHHPTLDDLKRSADLGCYICCIIWNELPSSDEDPLQSVTCASPLTNSSLAPNLEQPEQPKGPYVKANLWTNFDALNGHLHCNLSFALKNTTEYIARFYLDATGLDSRPKTYILLTDNTSSDEVVQLAREWLLDCSGPYHSLCPSGGDSDNSEPYYPTRLIELDPRGPKDRHPPGSEDPNGGEILIDTVRLVTTQDWKVAGVSSGQPVRKHDDVSPFPDQSSPIGCVPRGHYATLSHCWGTANFLQLRRENEEELKKEILLEDLPPTFRDAIRFLRRLSSSIKYIWIDSLCIRQGDKDDWAAESIKMYDVYRNSYLNISATAATDSSKGLFVQRQSHRVWTADVDVNLKGLSGGDFSMTGNGNPNDVPAVRKFKIYFPYHWTILVDDAPVNRRGWVLQERLLAPRILHFCEDQIAWECGHVFATESCAQGLRLSYGEDVLLRLRRELAYERMEDMAENDENDENGRDFGKSEALTTVRHWCDVVGRYSNTALSEPRDKLIALSGLAEVIGHRIGHDVVYVAGMWAIHLAEQLLWYVHPVYNNRQLGYPQRRAKEWRAPSFSWAALDTPQGISFRRASRLGSFQISIEAIHVRPYGIRDPVPDRRRFGRIDEECYIDIDCCLWEIEIWKEDYVHRGSEMSNGYKWALVPTRQTPKADNSELGTEDTCTEDDSISEDLRNIDFYQDPSWTQLRLDSPYDDFGGTGSLLEEGKTYCIPVSDYVWLFLLVQRLEGKRSEGHGNIDCYRRIGIAELDFYYVDKEVLDLKIKRAGRQNIRLV